MIHFSFFFILQSVHLGTNRMVLNEVLQLDSLSSPDFESGNK